MPNTEKYAKYDAAEFLRTPEEIQQFLEIVFEESQDDPAAIAAAIGEAKRAHGLVRTA
jgi:probable addiction module antidote protein